jgi:hypothetical protein
MLTGLLFVAPALALLVLLWARRYPAERRLVAIARRRRWPRRVPALRAAVARRPFASVPRGNRLLACALANRPPPPAYS